MMHPVRRMSGGQILEVAARRGRKLALLLGIEKVRLSRYYLNLKNVSVARGTAPYSVYETSIHRGMERKACDNASPLAVHEAPTDLELLQYISETMI
jgi:hypothetical protein